MITPRILEANSWDAGENILEMSGAGGVSELTRRSPRKRQTIAGTDRWALDAPKRQTQPTENGRSVAKIYAAWQPRYRRGAASRGATSAGFFASRSTTIYSTLDQPLPTAHPKFPSVARIAAAYNPAMVEALREVLVPCPRLREVESDSSPTTSLIPLTFTSRSGRINGSIMSEA
ncbi:hypothetical protein V8D89_009953 [Ganoderma adspersum]